MKLIIAEKPSVARNIVSALNIKNKEDGYYEGNGYYVTWVIGHLLQLYDLKDYDKNKQGWKMEYFPFIPSQYKYKATSDTGRKKQVNIIGNLIKNSSEIIICTDDDREGELIGATLMRYFNVQKPIKRVLLNEWTPKEVRKGFSNIKPITELKTRIDAGYSRQWADWAIGINLTCVTTLKYVKGRGMLNVGRVILPTLKIVYDRDKEIENFKPESYYKLYSKFVTSKNESYDAVYKEDYNDKFKDKKYLDELKRNMNNKATVINKEVNKKNEYPQILFNMTALQGYVTTKNRGWTPDKVLKVAQSLYEKKLITYPRTNSRALEDSLVDKARDVLNTHKAGLSFENEIKFTTSKRVFDNSKVESHSAIIPTYMKGKQLTADEKVVYDAVINRFLMQFMPVAQYEETIIETKVTGLKGYFYTKGKVEIKKGWKKLENFNSNDSVLPYVEINENVSIDKLNVTSHQSQPPKPHTYASLLRVMETCGKKVDDDEEDSDDLMSSILAGYSIGTGATRSEAIKKVISIGYINSKGKTLQCSEVGKKIVEQYPIRNLFNLDYTGKLEKTLKDIEKGNVSRDEFLDFINEFVIESVNTIKEDKDKVLLNTVEKNSLGKCPLCGSTVRKIKGKYGTFYSCSNYKNCSFKIGKIANKLLSDNQVKQLLENRKTGRIKGFKKKDGTPLVSAMVILKDDGSIKLDFS
ncbi:MAG: DNA topoisomerase [Candidatus Woesearchaeota archaeon]